MTEIDIETFLAELSKQRINTAGVFDVQERGRLQDILVQLSMDIARGHKLLIDFISEIIKPLEQTVPSRDVASKLLILSELPHIDRAISDMCIEGMLLAEGDKFGSYKYYSDLVNAVYKYHIAS